MKRSPATMRKAFAGARRGFTSGSTKLPGAPFSPMMSRLPGALASVVAQGDPTSRGARLVLAATGGNTSRGTLRLLALKTVPCGAAAFVAFARSLAPAGCPPGKLSIGLAAMAHDPLVPGDDRVVRVAVELVSRGLLAEEVLPPDGAVELAAIRGEPPPASVPTDPHVTSISLWRYCVPRPSSRAILASAWRPCAPRIPSWPLRGPSLDSLRTYLRSIRKPPWPFSGATRTIPCWRRLRCVSHSVLGTLTSPAELVRPSPRYESSPIEGTSSKSSSLSLSLSLVQPVPNVAACISEIDVALRHEPQYEREQRAYEQSRIHVSRPHRYGDGRARCWFTHVHIDHDAQVVVRSDDAVKEGKDHEHVEAAIDGGAKNEPLGKEARGRRYPREGHEEHRERQRRSRVATTEAREVFVAHRFPAATSAHLESVYRTRRPWRPYTQEDRKERSRPRSPAIERGP